MSAKPARVERVQETPRGSTARNRRSSLMVVHSRESNLFRLTEELEFDLGRRKLSGRQISMLTKFAEVGDRGLPYTEWFAMQGTTRRSMLTHKWVVISKRDYTARLTPIGRRMVSLLKDEERIYKKDRENLDHFDTYLETVKALGVLVK